MNKKRQKRVRAKVRGTKDMPRLSMYRSNRYLYGQLINDEKAVTIVGISEKELENKKVTKSARAKTLGTLFAKKVIAKKIKKVRFDRGSYKYHGRVKAFAEGAREGGLKF
ncbi:MAG: 50S ribosomal protein L18 [Candidatus Levybacteria bacterium]|nr:50S ribosomal protein L18 [Candidatus Levybacteria bacterium]